MEDGKTSGFTSSQKTMMHCILLALYACFIIPSLSIEVSDLNGRIVPSTVSPTANAYKAMVSWLMRAQTSSSMNTAVTQSYGQSGAHSVHSKCDLPCQSDVQRKGGRCRWQRSGPLVEGYLAFGFYRCNHTDRLFIRTLLERGESSWAEHAEWLVRLRVHPVSLGRLASCVEDARSAPTHRRVGHREVLCVIRLEIGGANFELRYSGVYTRDGVL